ncbi:hypothetical protein RN001_000716 [Aquatica leii]|uniref:Mutator-like transposase domain-containing protein n=1 Tax=Aquatica leii TaxID=1421715 RepID=A0AAN7SSH9_9COLE|nr:hypothetical protein RN001_000716 [Aquatica leii]
MCVSSDTKETQCDVDDVLQCSSSSDTSDNDCDPDLKEDDSVPYEVEIEEPSNTSKFSISGRQVVDISYFLQELKSLKYDGFDCSFFDMDLISEKRCGLSSTFMFQCNVCNTISKIASENLKTAMSSNMAAVIGSVSIGIGHTQVTELFASLDIPNMCDKTYGKLHLVIAED